LAGTVDAVTLSERALPTEPTRTLPLEQIFNFRDLGGYETADGRRTRWRILYRADGLHRLREADLDAVRRLGLRTVIDLRTPEEIEERGRFPVDDHPVEYHHLSLMDVIWDKDDRSAHELSAGEFLLIRYLEMLSTAEDRVANAFRILAAPGALPGVFHCAAGKDRTGLLAALVLSSLGVDDEQVVADYALSDHSRARLLEWAREADPQIVEAIESMPAVFLAADPVAMEDLLALIRQAHGSTREYVMSLGVEDADLARLETALLE
jgi:protein-tyrosine phosphatase